MQHAGCRVAPWISTDTQNLNEYFSQLLRTCSGNVVSKQSTTSFRNKRQRSRSIAAIGFMLSYRCHRILGCHLHCRKKHCLDEHYLSMYVIMTYLDTGRASAVQICLKSGRALLFAGANNCSRIRTVCPADNQKTLLS